MNSNVVHCDRPLQVTRIKATVPACLSKSYQMTGDGLDKKSAGQLVRGEYKIRDIRSAIELADELASLHPNEALIYGIPQRAETQGSIASRKEARPGEITRTRDNFDWPAGPAVMFLDYDHRQGAEPLTANMLWELIITSVPELANAPAVVTASATSYIYDKKTGKEIKGAGGWHVYLIVKDGRDIPRAGQALFEQTWMTGHGWFMVSSAGSLLERSLIDTTVWQPERLDFAAGAVCLPPIEQRRPAPLVKNPDAKPFDSQQLRRVSAIAELERLKSIASAAVAEEAKKVRDRWIEARVADVMVTVSETDADKREERSKILRVTYRRAAEDGLLLGDFVLTTEDGRQVTVGEILDNVDHWHGKRFADPLERDYRNDSRVAWANLQSGGKPIIFSHAHGGRRYVLVRAPQTIQVSGGEMPRIVEAVQRHMHRAGEVYQRGGELVRVADGLTLVVHPAWLRTHAETVARFEKWKNNASQPTDCPSDLHQRIIANRGGWPFPELVGVATAPTMRLDGTLLDRPGYDKETGLLLLAEHPDRWPSILFEPTKDQVRSAILCLWQPFESFPFVKSVDRAIALTAMLTAVVRQMLPTAPAFGITAFHAGTGKTKLARCLGILTNGRVPSVTPWSDNPEEQRKSLMAALLAGPGALLLDNIERPVSSAELCAAITSEKYEDRRLGFSERLTASTRVLLMATGNNLSIVGDLARRVLPVGLDHGVERPETLSFPFDPVVRVAERWLYLRAAALTILRGFVVAGRPSGGKGCVGSFEIWDELVRQCVVWMRDNELAPFKLDPADAVADTVKADPETQKLRSLLYCWNTRFGETAVTVAGLVGAGLHFSNESDELAEILAEIAGEGVGINRRRLGRWIERHAGRRLDGLRIIDAGGHTNGSRRWQVVAS